MEEGQEGQTPEERRRAVYSTSAWALLLNGFVFFLVAAALSVGLIFWAKQQSKDVQHLLILEGGRYILPTPLPLIVIVLWVFGRIMVAIDLRSERAWLASLPFSVERYWWLLGVGPWNQWRKLFIALSFAGAKPDDAAIIEILSGDGAKWTITNEDGQMLFLREPGLGRKDDERNRRTRRWFHRFAAAQLATLHQRHRLSAIRFVDSR
jgi:hypothetical protein